MRRTNCKKFFSPEGQFATFRGQVQTVHWTGFVNSYFSWLYLCSLKKKNCLFFFTGAVAQRLVRTTVQPDCYPHLKLAAFTNQSSVRSCWTKRTEEHLTAYRWHCITQNSFGLCYAHLPLLIHIWHGWMVILPEENWKRLCTALQYVLPSSLSMFPCSGEAAKQQPRE